MPDRVSGDVLGIRNAEGHDRLDVYTVNERTIASVIPHWPMPSSTAWYTTRPGISVLNTTQNQEKE